MSLSTRQSDDLCATFAGILEARNPGTAWSVRPVKRRERNELPAPRKIGGTLPGPTDVNPVSDRAASAA